MATSIPSPNTVNAVAMAMYDLQRIIVGEGRIRATTGGIFDRLTTPIASGTGFVVGSLEGDDYWRWVGNGRRPGAMPPVDRIAEWVRRAGINASPWAIAKRIAKEGSRNFRMKKTNIFSDGIDKWEKGQSITAAADAFGKDTEDAAFDVLRTKLKRN